MVLFMADTDCGHCGRLVHMEAASGLHINRGPEHTLQTARYEAAYRCPNCTRLSLASEVRGHQGVSSEAPKSAAQNHQWINPTWIPIRGHYRDFPDVPHHISRAASEAAFCFSVGAYRAAGALTRAVIEATAKDKGITSGSLWAKIDQMHAQQLLREHIRDAAHEVRHFGNDMAHGDFVDEVAAEEAEEAIELMAEVLNEVYQSRARIERVKATRLSKKAD